MGPTIVKAWPLKDAPCEAAEHLASVSSLQDQRAVWAGRRSCQCHRADRVFPWEGQRHTLRGIAPLRWRLLVCLIFKRRADHCGLVPVRLREGHVAVLQQVRRSQNPQAVVVSGRQTNDSLHVGFQLHDGPDRRRMSCRLSSVFDVEANLELMSAGEWLVSTAPQCQLGHAIDYGPQASGPFGMDCDGSLERRDREVAGLYLLMPGTPLLWRCSRSQMAS